MIFLLPPGKFQSEWIIPVNFLLKIAVPWGSRLGINNFLPWYKLLLRNNGQNDWNEFQVACISQELVWGTCLLRADCFDASKYGTSFSRRRKNNADVMALRLPSPPGGDRTTLFLAVQEEQVVRNKESPSFSRCTKFCMIVVRKFYDMQVWRFSTLLSAVAS